MSPPIPYNQRIAGMTQAVTDLRSKHFQVTQELARNTNSTSAAFATAALGVLYPLLKRVTQVEATQDSVETSLKVTAKAIDVLDGTDTDTIYGDMFIKASTDDNVFQQWGEMAQQTGETLGMALGLSSYDVSQFIGRVGTQIKQNADETLDDIKPASYLIVVILGLVFLIILLK